MSDTLRKFSESCDSTPVPILTAAASKSACGRMRARIRAIGIVCGVLGTSVLYSGDFSHYRGGAVWHEYFRRGKSGGHDHYGNNAHSPATGLDPGDRMAASSVLPARCAERGPGKKRIAVLLQWRAFSHRHHL